MMDSDSLELRSTNELVEELLRRTTFQGVIVHSLDEAKTREWDTERTFRVRHNSNLDTEEVGRLLDVVSRHIARCD
jgi:hypothetical protein